MISAILIIFILGALDVMLFVACVEMEKEEEERRRMRERLNRKK